MPDQQPERWIFCFKWFGTRSLTEDEKRDLLARSRRLSSVKYLRGLFAVVLAVGAFAGIIFAAHGNPYGWIVIIAGTAAFIWALSWAGSSERLALLYRRAARLGEVHRYDLVEGQRITRLKFSFKCEHDEWASPSWEEDEKFLEALQEVAGKKVEWLETPAGDAVILYVERKPVDRIVDVSILESL